MSQKATRAKCHSTRGCARDIALTRFVLAGADDAANGKYRAPGAGKLLLPRVADADVELRPASARLHKTPLTSGK